MLDGIQALIIIEKLGTISEAAVELRLTQSAVTKRIQSLEYEIGTSLLQKDGRRIRLTKAGFEFLAKAKPLFAAFQNLKKHGQVQETRNFSIGIADSLAASWAPSVLRKTMKSIPSLKLEVHVHRSTLIIENIKLGRYDLGLITGHEPDSTLASCSISMEEMVLVGNPPQGRSPMLLTIETASATWKEIGKLAREHPSLVGRNFEFVESFTAAAQMAREGFGQALVPIGVATSLGFSSSEMHLLSPKIKRRIQLVARKSILEIDLIVKFVKLLPETIKETLAAFR